MCFLSDCSGSAPATATIRTAWPFPAILLVTKAEAPARTVAVMFSGGDGHSATSLRRSSARRDRPFHDSPLRRNGRPDGALHGAPGQHEEPGIAVEVEVPVCSEHRSLQLEGELDRVDGASELAEPNPVSRRASTSGRRMRRRFPSDRPLDRIAGKRAPYAGVAE